ncbi:hypothetical protein As57867_005518, partial [Aphanomyces stellatus]
MPLLPQDWTSCDRVDHSYLLTVLRHYGFPQVFVDMVRVLYSDKKFMTDKTAEKSIGECQAILRLEPAVVAHSLYSGPNDSALLNALIASHAVERKMACYKHQGKPSNYRDYLDTSNLSQVGLKCPRAILEAITTSSEDEVLMAVAALDLYLCNRAPDLYTNYEAIEVLLG